MSNSNNIRYDKIINTYELSNEQNAVLFSDMNSTEPLANLLLFCFELRGVLVLDIFEKAINILIEKHEALHTIIEFSDKTKQARGRIIHRQFNLQVVDIPDPITTDLIVKKAIDKPMDLIGGLLWDLTLFRVFKNKFILLFRIHHIFFDAQSSDIFFRDLNKIYNDLLENNKTFEEQVNGYGLYAALQKDDLQNDFFWRDYLAGSTDLLSSVIKFNSTTEKPVYGVYEFELSEKFMDEMNQFRSIYKVNQYIFFLAVYMCFWHIYSDTDSVLIGSPVAGGRALLKFKDTIGYFVKVLPIHSKIQEDIPFNIYVKIVQHQVFDVMKHYKNDYRNILRELSNYNGKAPLRTVFAYQNNGFTGIDFESLSAKRLPTPNFRQDEYDLITTVVQGENTVVRFEYNKELFPVQMIKRQARYYNILLEKFLDNPAANIKSTSFYSRVDYVQFNENNNFCISYPKTSLYSMVKRRAGDSMAVIDESESITYRELIERAEKLAAYMYKLGIQSNSRVGVMCGRNSDYIISILSVLKLGCSYVPLSPEYPTDRLDYIAKDSNMAIIITVEQFKHKMISMTCGIPFLILNRSIYLETCGYVDDFVNSNDAAYIIYTSGSTGIPKGVECKQESVINLINYIHYRSPLAPEDRCAFWTNISFDVSVYEIFTALIFGCTLIAVPEKIRIDDISYLNWIHENDIHCVYVPPMMIKNLPNCSFKVNYNTKRILTGVEPIDFNDLIYWQKCFINACIINGYGPSETTICSTLYFFSADVISKVDRVPIGAPISNTGIYLLNSRQKPVPKGVVGEIYISGIGLANGYIGAASDTKDKFVRISPWDEVDIVAYRTGDMAYQLEDGNLIFVGRNDRQVKINGFRIELGEIEQTLKKYSLIDEVVVIDIEHVRNSKILVAFIVADDYIEISEIKDFIANKLPSYMMPHFIQQIDKIPVTINGKTDKEQLYKIWSDYISEGNDTPKGYIEEILFKIWEEVLQVSIGSPNDNFYFLGGDSLDAAIIMNRIETELQVKVDINTFLNYPTISELGKKILNCKYHSMYNEIPQVPSGDLHPVTLQQKDYIESYEDEDLYLNNILYVCQMSTDLDMVRLKKSIIEVLAVNESLCSYFVKEKEIYYYLVNYDPRNYEISEFDFESEQLENYAEKFRREIIDIFIPPLFKIQIGYCESKEPYLFMCFHHAIFDGWSLEILLSQIASRYNGMQTDCDKSASITEYGYWYQKFMNSEIYNKQLEYWSGVLSGYNEYIKLFQKGYEPLNLMCDKDFVKYRLSKPTLVKVKTLILGAQTTVSNFYLAILFTLIYKMSGQKDIIINMPVHNRLNPLFERTIGCLANDILLRIKVEPKAKFVDLIQQIHIQMATAMSNQDVNILEVLQNTSVDINKLFRVRFSYQNFSHDLKLDIKETKKIHLDIMGSSANDFTVYIYPVETCMEIFIEYNVEKYTRDESLLFLKQYLKILEITLENSQIIIDDL